MSLLTIIFICYLAVGFILVGFTRVRHLIISEAREAKNRNGEPAPPYKVLMLTVILVLAGLLLWPFFLSAWFRRPNKLYQIIKENLPADGLPTASIEGGKKENTQPVEADEVANIEGAIFPFPQIFCFEIGGFMGSAHQLSLNKAGELEYRFAPRFFRWKPPIILKPSQTKWAVFWKEIESVNFWQWQPEYRTSCRDGTQWSCHVRVSGRCQNTSGSNGYPEGRDAEYPEGGQFDLFLKAIQKLSDINEIR